MRNLLTQSKLKAGSKVTVKSGSVLEDLPLEFNKVYTVKDMGDTVLNLEEIDPTNYFFNLDLFEIYQVFDRNISMEKQDISRIVHSIMIFNDEGNYKNILGSAIDKIENNIVYLKFMESTTVFNHPKYVFVNKINPKEYTVDLTRCKLKFKPSYFKMKDGGLLTSEIIKRRFHLGDNLIRVYTDKTTQKKGNVNFNELVDEDGFVPFKVVRNLQDTYGYITVRLKDGSYLNFDGYDLTITNPSKQKVPFQVGLNVQVKSNLMTGTISEINKTSGGVYYTINLDNNTTVTVKSKQFKVIK